MSVKCCKSCGKDFNDGSKRQTMHFCTTCVSFGKTQLDDQLDRPQRNWKVLEGMAEMLLSEDEE